MNVDLLWINIMLVSHLLCIYNQKYILKKKKKETIKQYGKLKTI